MKLRSFFKLLAGAAVAPKVVAQPNITIAGLDPCFTSNGFELRYMDMNMPRWYWMNGKWEPYTKLAVTDINPDYVSCQNDPQLDSNL